MKRLEADGLKIKQYLLQKAPDTMQRTLFSAGFAALLAAAFLLAMPSCKKKKDVSSDEEMTVDVAYPVVDTVTLTRTFPGFLKAANTVDVVARVNGYLRAKCYTDGAYVSKGAVLFRIEDTQYRDAVEQAEAALRTAQATYDYNVRNYEAMKRALQSDAVSEMSVIHAESEMKNSQAAIRNAQAALETARTNLGYCVVTAPVSGHITASIPDVGSYLSGAGAPVTLATIYDDASLQAHFSVGNPDIYSAIQNYSTTSGLDFKAIPLTFQETLAHPYTANLSYVAPDIDTSTGSLALKAKVDNKYGELKDGMYVTVTLPYSSVPNAILVKDASISTDQAGKYLYVVNDSCRVIYTPIKVGELIHDSLRIVTSGLSKDARYVTKAMQKVTDGMKVKPVTVR